MDQEQRRLQDKAMQLSARFGHSFYLVAYPIWFGSESLVQHLWERIKASDSLREDLDRCILVQLDT